MKREAFRRKFLPRRRRGCDLSPGAFSKVGDRNDRSISENLIAFHHERSRGEEAKHSSESFTVREIAASVHADEKIKNPFDRVLTCYGLSYPGEVHAAIIS
jgi:hypothetical protein